MMAYAIFSLSGKDITTEIELVFPVDVLLIFIYICKAQISIHSLFLCQRISHIIFPP